MRRSTILRLFVLGIPLFAAGCVTTERIYYLQDVDINASVTRPPIHITTTRNANELHIIPRMAFSTQRTLRGQIEGHPPVNRNGVFQVDTIFGADNSVQFRDPGGVNTYEFAGTNLTWKPPLATFGLDVDYSVGQSVSLSVGASLSRADDGRGLWGYRAGLGFKGLNERKTLGWRLDLGWQWQEHAFTATTVVTERPLSSQASLVYFYEDKNRKQDGSYYASLTLNSIQLDNAFNYFFQLGLTRQVIGEFQPNSVRQQAWLVPPFFIMPYQGNIVIDKRGMFNATAVHVTPGLYFNIDEDLILVVGADVAFGTSIKELSPGTIVMPVVQLDWRL